jgi:hypothetical protein
MLATPFDGHFGVGNRKAKNQSVVVGGRGDGSNQPSRTFGCFAILVSKLHVSVAKTFRNSETREMTGTDLPQTAAALRSRAAHVRGLMMQLTSQADQDRLGEYANDLDAKAAKLERGDGQSDET